MQDIEDEVKGVGERSYPPLRRHIYPSVDFIKSTLREARKTSLPQPFRQGREEWQGDDININADKTAAWSLASDSSAFLLAISHQFSWSTR
jgi:hypothetical protein